MEALKNLQAQLKVLGLYGGEIDGKWGPVSQAAFNALIARSQPSPVVVPTSEFRKNLGRQLEEEEDRVPHVYQDHLGFWTGGVGRLLDKRKGGRFREDEIDFMLDNDINEKSAEVYKALPWVRDLSDARRAVIIGMAFQMGTAGLLKFGNTLAAIQRGDYKAGADGMLASLWAKQTAGRANRMAKQLVTDKWQFRT